MEDAAPCESMKRGFCAEIRVRISWRAEQRGHNERIEDIEYEARFTAIFFNREVVSWSWR